MSDYTSLRPPLSPSAAGINRASSPVAQQKHSAALNAHSRYSLGKGSTPTENMMRLAQQGNQEHGIRSPSIGAAAQMHGGAGGGGGARNLRPSSEMLNMGPQGTPESEAIDRWFEDLQHYEATLEEMATASLDQNFKEELSAIEQWFRVLSEAERTAALYSLLQESTQVQIRFFITVLQQMARSDPVSALLSPSNPNSSMADQMEAKLASLGLKSPSAMKSPASPGGAGGSNRHFQRQSSDAAGFLSPNAAAMYNPGNSDAASALAAQRAKLKANRTSAPGTLLGESRNFSGGNLDQVQERGIERGDSPANDSLSRPKSTDLSNMVGRSPRATGPLDDQLSPISATGNWSSMVNTPLVPMFEDHGDSNVNLDAAAAQLAGLNQPGAGRVMVDQDVSKFRRKSNQNGGQQQHQQQQQGGQPQVQGVLSGMYEQGNGSSPGMSPNMAAHAGWGTSPLSAPTPTFAGTNFSMGAMSPNALAGLQSPTGGMSNPINLQMMNAMAAMGGLNLNNMNAAQFLAMQQQILQNQQNLAAFAQQSQQQANHRGGAQRGGFGGLSPGLGPLQGAAGGRRSPRAAASPGARTVNLGSAPGAGNSGGAGGGEEEVADISILNDVPQWLRHLRLHKYTPNFEGSTWREMVIMSDKDLEDKGVAALGARRKMLKTFEAARQKYNITLPGDAAASNDQKAAAAASAATDDVGADDDATESKDAQEVDRELGTKQ